MDCTSLLFSICIIFKIMRKLVAYLRKKLYFCSDFARDVSKNITYIITENNLINNYDIQDYIFLRRSRRFSSRF